MNQRNRLGKKGWKKKASSIRLLLLDVDGVLTDGRVVYDGTGQEWKFFDIRDGQGIKLLQQSGVEVGLISGRGSPAVHLRAKELGISLVRQKVVDKAVALEEIQQRRNLEVDEIGFVGDDLADLPILSRVGFAVAVSDAVPEVKAHAHYITRHPGGGGAVREVCEQILKTQGKWETTVQKFIGRQLG